MPEEMDCKDGFCQMHKPYKEIKAGDILFAPIEDDVRDMIPKASAQTEDSRCANAFCSTDVILKTLNARSTTYN